MATILSTEALDEFRQAMALAELPYVAFSTNAAPDHGVTPKKDAKANQCVMAYFQLARRKRKPVYFSRGQAFCPGGQLYTNVVDEIPEFIAEYVSTGIEGFFEGERYCSSPEVMRQFLEKVKLPPDSNQYRVFKPIEQLSPAESPEVVIFFCSPDVLTGLFVLVGFYTNDLEAMIAPFGAGCTNIYTWVRKYMLEGNPKVVLGGLDITARPFIGENELSLSMPYTMFLDLLECYKDSFVYTRSWEMVKKRIARQGR